MYKKLLPVILGLLLLNNLTKAQMISSDKNRYYEFLVECPIYKCNITGKIIDTALLVAPPNSKFILVDMKQDQCIIRFTMFSNNKKTNNKKSSSQAVVPKNEENENKSKNTHPTHIIFLFYWNRIVRIGMEFLAH